MYPRLAPAQAQDKSVAPDRAFPLRLCCSLAASGAEPSGALRRLKVASAFREKRRTELLACSVEQSGIASGLGPLDADPMMVRSNMLMLPAAALAACSDRSDPVAHAQPDQGEAENLSIKDQVLEILCDNENRNVQEALVQVVEYARKRDGRSDRVWEVADEADCDESNRSA